MAKFKELLQEAVGGVVSTPAINAGHGSTMQRSDADLSGDSRVDTGGNFTFRADELPDSDFSHTANPKQAFSEGGDSSSSVVLHEDEEGSVTLRNHGSSYDVVIRDGSDEKVYELDEDAAKKVHKFFVSS